MLQKNFCSNFEKYSLEVRQKNELFFFESFCFPKFTYGHVKYVSDNPFGSVFLENLIIGICDLIVFHKNLSPGHFENQRLPPEVSYPESIFLVNGVASSLIIARALRNDCFVIQENLAMLQYFLVFFEKKK